MLGVSDKIFKLVRHKNNVVIEHIDCIVMVTGNKNNT
jgi:hypothetical protein